MILLWVIAMIAYMSKCEALSEDIKKLEEAKLKEPIDELAKKKTLTKYAEVTLNKARARKAAEDNAAQAEREKREAEERAANKI